MGVAPGEVRKNGTRPAPVSSEPECSSGAAATAATAGPGPMGGPGQEPAAVRRASRGAERFDVNRAAVVTGTRSASPLSLFGAYLRERFGARVWKLPVDAGFTCPNLDGRLGTRGCAYCENRSFSPAVGRRSMPLAEQIEREKALARERYGAEKFIVYFQPFTNTYGDLPRLAALYEEALGVADVVGLAVGTRPDCAPGEVLDLLASFAPRAEVWIEFGLQSSHDSTLSAIGRGHTFATFLDAVARAKQRGLLVCAHVILGLPGETRKMIRETAERLGSAGIDGIKIHHLHVSSGAPAAEEYAAGRLRLLSLNEYISLAADFIERTPARVVVQRWVSEVSGPTLLAPRWGVPKQRILAEIVKGLHRRGTRQGARCSGAVDHAGDSPSCRGK